MWLSIAVVRTHFGFVFKGEYNKLDKQARATAKYNLITIIIIIILQG